MEDEAPTRSMTFPPRLAQFPLSVFRFQFMVSHPSTFNITVVKTTASKKRKGADSNSRPAGR